VPLATPARQVRCRRPLGVESGPSRNSGELPRRLEPVGRSSRAALGERRQHQPVPRGDRLVVAQRLRPLLADREERARSSASSSPRSTKRPCSNGCSSSAPDRALELPRPRERQPLDAVGVRVLGRREAAAVERAASRAGRRARAARCRRASSRSAARATLVDRVAVEAAAELVVDAAGRHRVERARSSRARARRARSRNSITIAGGNFGAPARSRPTRVELRSRAGSLRARSRIPASRLAGRSQRARTAASARPS
jgi:hypothetical protein